MRELKPCPFCGKGEFSFGFAFTRASGDGAMYEEWDENGSPITAALRLYDRAKKADQMKGTEGEES